MAYLFINKFYAIFIGHFFDNAEHKHHAIQLCTNLNSDLEISIGNTKNRGKSFLIAPDCPHKIIKNKGELFILFLDPETEAGKNLTNKYLSSEQFAELDLSFITDNIYEPITPESVSCLIADLFKKLKIEQERELNPRVIEILELIEQSPLKKIKTGKIAKEFNLSESRIQHIFKEEVGISIQKFLLWKRIGSAVQLTKCSNDLTWIAHEAGFSDSAHFSRTFKQMFGVCLKDLFKTAAKVNVHFLS